MSYKCQRCGDPYEVDVLIPDDLWEEIKPAGNPVGAGLLCGKCIFQAIEDRGKGAFHLCSGDEFDAYIQKSCGDIKTRMIRLMEIEDELEIQLAQTQQELKALKDYSKGQGIALLKAEEELEKLTHKSPVVTAPFVLEVPEGFSFPAKNSMIPGRHEGETVITGVIHIGESLVKELLEENQITIK